MLSDTSNPLQDAIDTADLLICIGSGGVGKTTTSAALALHAALSGRRTLVLTIDPARRLLQALGLGDGNWQANTPLEVLPRMADTLGPAASTASLHAMMLDPERGAEEMVARLLDDPELHDEVLGNRIYRALLPALTAAPDYVALELIADLHASGRFDLIVLDTPPAHNMMDFLAAGGTFSSFVNERVIRFFSMVPGAQTGRRRGFIQRGGNVAMRLLGKLFGSEVLPDIASFFWSFRDVMPRMKARNNATDALLSSDATRFIAVTAPGETSLREAHHMRALLRRRELPFGGFVVNRVLSAPPALVDGEQMAAGLEHIAARLKERGMDDRRIADFRAALSGAASGLLAMENSDREHVRTLADLAGAAAFCATAPQLEHDIHVLTELRDVAQGLILSTDRAYTGHAR